MGARGSLEKTEPAAQPSNSSLHVFLRWGIRRCSPSIRGGGLPRCCSIVGKVSRRPGKQVAHVRGGRVSSQLQRQSMGCFAYPPPVLACFCFSLERHRARTSCDRGSLSGL